MTSKSTPKLTTTPTDCSIRDFHYFRKLRNAFPIAPIMNDVHLELATAILDHLKAKLRIFPSEQLYMEDLATTIGMYRARRRDERKAENCPTCHRK